MNALKATALGLAAGLALAVPQPADAQSSDGWWQWALQEVSQNDDRDRDGTTIGDIIFGRDDDRRDDRRDDDRRTTDRRDDRRDDDRRDDDRRTTDRRDSRNGDRNARGGNGQRGPKFCQRGGDGHPVHGRQWCRDKGFGTGSGTVWNDRGTLGDIIFGSPRDGRKDDRRGTVSQGGLADVLGDVVFGRLDSQRQRLGGTAPLEGRWLQPRDGAMVLQIRSGNVPVAELTDVNGDGRVDYALTPRPRR